MRMRAGHDQQRGLRTTPGRRRRRRRVAVAGGTEAQRTAVLHARAGRTGRARGDTAGALGVAAAFTTVQGPANAQWGVLYVEGLLKLAPDDAPRIEQATASLIAELAQPSGYHISVPASVSERLAGQLKTWSGKHQGAVIAGAVAAADAAGVGSRWMAPARIG